MDVTGDLFLETLKKIQVPFYISGLPLHNSDKNNIVLRLIFLWNFTCIITDLIGVIVFFCNGINTIDFVSLSFIAPCIFYGLVSYSKALCLLLNEKEIRKLIKMFMSLEEKVKFYNSEGIYLSTRNSFHRFIKIFNIVYVISLVVFLVAPLSLMALKYYQGKFELVYLFSITYPFNHYRIEFFPMAYLHQAWTATVVLAFISSADYFYYTCCSYIHCHFKLLQRQFEAILPHSSNSYNKLTFADIRTEFEELVKWHQQVISLSSMLENIYAKSALYNFLSSSVLICLTLFNITKIKDTFMMTFFAFLFLCLVQMYLLCYFGDKIKQASVEVSDAAFNSLWYLSDPSVGKHMLIVLMRAQKPCKLTTLGFTDVNQRAFMTILSNAWSYFALLNTIYH